MSIIMKLLAGLIVVAALIIFSQLSKHTPYGREPEVFLFLIGGIVIPVAVLYALGEILAKLNVVIASLDRPQVAPSRSIGEKAKGSPAEQFLSGGSQASTE